MNKRSAFKNKKRQKDYQVKGLKNPFFRIKKKTSSKFVKIRLILLFLFFIFVVWFFWFSPVFNIKNIKVQGLNRVKPELIMQISWQQTEANRFLIFTQKNIFSYDNRSLIKNINSTFNFSKLEINKKWWARELIIKIEERPYAFIWQEGAAYYFSDKDGNLINDESVSEEQKKQYFILENRAGNTLILDNKQININKDYLPFIFAVNEKIKNNPDFKVNRYYINNELNTIKLVLDNGPEIYFSTREEPLGQLTKLITVKRETIKDSFDKLKYIDLRYKDKVYYQ